MKKKIFFINHKKSNCGVYEFGKRIGKVLNKSKKFNFVYLEISSLETLEKKYNSLKPHLMIYNYTGDTMPWVKTYKFSIPQISIIHEITSSISKNTYPNFTDYYIAPDPSLIRNNILVYKTSRLIFKNNNNLRKKNSLIKIGSFGFGSKNKNFLGVVRAVSKEFNKAEINFIIPAATFGDINGCGSKEQVKKCIKYLKKFPNIKFNFSHNYIPEKKLIDFLRQNDLNVFLYNDKRERGISSVIDYALSAGKPVAISKCNMFRHINNPSIVYSNKNSLKSIISRKDTYIKKFIDSWTPENLIWEYEVIIEEILKNYSNKYLFIYNFKYLKFKIEKFLRNFFKKNNLFLIPWSVGDNYALEKSKFQNYKISKKKIIIKKYNRFLTKKDLHTFSTSINNLNKIAPDTMKKKNNLAVQQQGFITDAIQSLIKDNKKKILCVGSYQDPTYEALYRYNYNIEGIDPLLNCDLKNFMHKPSTKNNSYDLIYSTSVLEHVYDDITFLKNCESLLKKGGFLILTCDYKKDFKNGDPVPGVSYRFYNEKMIKKMLKAVSQLEMIDSIDFNKNNENWFGSTFRYTFCALTLKKIS